MLAEGRWRKLSFPVRACAAAVEIAARRAEPRAACRCVGEITDSLIARAEANHLAQNGSLMTNDHHQA